MEADKRTEELCQKGHHQRMQAKSTRKCRANIKTADLEVSPRSTSEGAADALKATLPEGVETTI